MFAHSYQGKLLYRWDNARTIAGLILVSWAIYHTATHLFILLSAAVCLLPALWKNRATFGLAALFLLIFMLVEPQSNKWKYGGNNFSVVYGREGEIAVDNESKMVLLNKRVYRMGYPYPSIEQSVHVPLSIRKANSVLLIHDNGHSAEVRKYNPSELVCIESEPLLADSGCICQTPERLLHKNLFDVVLLGSDIPENMAMSRLFTEDFFYRIKGMMTDSGLFSFTLSLNSNYLDKHEKKLKDLMIATLLQAFRVVKVFPGEGWTFVASDTPFEFATECKVPTGYFNDFILASVSSDKILSANQNPVKAGVNKAAHPLILKFTLERYLDQFKISISVMILSAFGLLIISVLIFYAGDAFDRNQSFFSGSYTIIIMMIYQSLFGTLYLRCTIDDCVIGGKLCNRTLIKRLSQSGYSCGCLCGIIFLLLFVSKNPPEILLFVFVMGLPEAQIVSCAISW